MSYFTKIVVIILLTISNNAFSEVAVIINSANSDNINEQVIKKIYLGKMKSFPNGAKVKVYTLPSNENDTEYFREKALKKSNSQFKSYWSKLLFTGKGIPATELKSAEDIIEAIKNDPQAIGFVNVSDIDKEVKVVLNY